MQDKLHKLISAFKLVQWQGDPPITNEEAFRQLAEYLVGNNAIVVPVKPGDTVYTISRNKIKEWTVYYLGMNTKNQFSFNFHDKNFQNSRMACEEDIGETVFLTEEDAINELKERKS